jgi:hypothetical protein
MVGISGGGEYKSGDIIVNNVCIVYLCSYDPVFRLIKKSIG